MVDWSKVPIDTLVLVKENKDDKFIPRYFAGVEESCGHTYYNCWSFGQTSKTANGRKTAWEFCQIAP